MIFRRVSLQAYELDSLRFFSLVKSELTYFHMLGIFHNASDEAKVILKRGPLLSSRLFSLIEPEHITDADVERSMFLIPKKDLPPPYWSPEF